VKKLAPQIREPSSPNLDPLSVHQSQPRSSHVDLLQRPRTNPRRLAMVQPPRRKYATQNMTLVVGRIRQLQRKLRKMLYPMNLLQRDVPLLPRKGRSELRPRLVDTNTRDRQQRSLRMNTFLQETTMTEPRQPGDRCATQEVRTVGVISRPP